MYYAGAQALGQSYDLAFDPLISAAGHSPQTPVRLAFVLAVVGYGTKVGFFPVHTWLPDAHAEAPTPVSALLSGSLLAVSFYAICGTTRSGRGTRTTFPTDGAAGLRCAVVAASSAVPTGTAKYQTPARLFECRTHGHTGDRHELRCADCIVRSAITRAGPRSREG